MSLSKEPLRTKRNNCFCGGSVKHFKNRFSTLTVYTESGPFICQHLEYRCSDCSRGFYFGYSTEVDLQGKEEDKDDDDVKRKYSKLYDEDCLEQEVRKVYYKYYRI